MQVFDFTDYREYLHSALERPGNPKRGMRARLAEALGVQASYLSQVLKGRSDISLEQADRVNNFLAHTDEQSEYFLLLVSLGRAGTDSLRQQLLRQAHRRQKQYQTLRHRISHNLKLKPTDQQEFYGSWQYAAVAMALTIPNLRTTEAISAKLRLNPQRVAHILGFLTRTGLADDEGGEYRPGKSWIHLGDNPELAARDNINWRQKAVDALERTAPTDLHYSSVASLSASDFKLIKTRLIAVIEEVRGTIKDSKEEKLCSLLVDFFEL